QANVIERTFAEIKEFSRTHKGARELRILIKNNDSQYTFVSDVLVDSAIKEHFSALHWVG
ncbi:hypothetical protein, partial [uncultured Helicobacter sp.]